MPLEVKGKTAQTPQAPAQAAPKPAPDTMLLELTMYQNYLYGKLTYVKGKAYKFKREDAIRLLGELDANRPIWRVYHPKPVRRAESTVVDATGVDVVAAEPVDVYSNDEQIPPAERIDVGDEGELADLNLGGEGNVQI